MSSSHSTPQHSGTKPTVPPLAWLATPSSGAVAPAPAAPAHASATPATATPLRSHHHRSLLPQSSKKRATLLGADAGCVGVASGCEGEGEEGGEGRRCADDSDEESNTDMHDVEHAHEHEHDDHDDESHPHSPQPDGPAAAAAAVAAGVSLSSISSAVSGPGGASTTLLLSNPRHKHKEHEEQDGRDGTSYVDSDSDGTGDASSAAAAAGDSLESLRSLPSNSSSRRRLSVACPETDESGGLIGPTTRVGGGGGAPFKIPKLNLPTPNSAHASSSGSSATNQASGSNAGSGAPYGSQRASEGFGASAMSYGNGAPGLRSKFLELKLICPSPEHVHAPPALSKEDKLLYFSRICSVLGENLAVSSRMIAQDWRQFESNGITHVVNCAGDICDNYFEHFDASAAAAAWASPLAGVPATPASSPQGPPVQTRPVKYLRLFLLDTQDEDITCVLYPVIEFIESARQEGRVQLTPQAMAAAMAAAAAAATSANANAASSTNGSITAVDDGDSQMGDADAAPAAVPSSPAAPPAPVPSSIPPRVLVHCQQGVSRSTALCIAYLMISQGRDYEDAYAIVRGIRGICRPNFGFIAQLKAWKIRMNGWDVAEAAAAASAAASSAHSYHHQHPLGRSRSVSRVPPPAHHVAEKTLMYLYRASPHCSRDRRIVLKLADVPVPTAAAIDSRSIFILVTRAVVYIWIGCLVLPQQEAAYMPQVWKQVARLRRWEHAPSFDVILRQEEEQKYATEEMARRRKAAAEAHASTASASGGAPLPDGLDPFGSSVVRDVYEVREPPPAEPLTARGGCSPSPDAPLALERSPSQTLFLSTLMSPTTLNSLNLGVPLPPYNPVPSAAGTGPASTTTGAARSTSVSPSPTPVPAPVLVPVGPSAAALVPPSLTSFATPVPRSSPSASASTNGATPPQQEDGAPLSPLPPALELQITSASPPSSQPPSQPASASLHHNQPTTASSSPSPHAYALHSKSQSAHSLLSPHALAAAAAVSSSIITSPSKPPMHPSTTTAAPPFYRGESGGGFGSAGPSTNSSPASTGRRITISPGGSPVPSPKRLHRTLPPGLSAALTAAAAAAVASSSTSVPPLAPQTARVGSGGGSGNAATAPAASAPVLPAASLSLNGGACGPSVPSTPRGGPTPASASSAGAASASSNGTAGVPDPSSLHWTVHSRTFWSLLNGTPVPELLVSEYDEDYPAHEWMALHLMERAASSLGQSSGGAAGFHRRKSKTVMPEGAGPGAAGGAGPIVGGGGGGVGPSAMHLGTPPIRSRVMTPQPPPQSCSGACAPGHCSCRPDCGAVGVGSIDASPIPLLSRAEVVRRNSRDSRRNSLQQAAQRRRSSASSTHTAAAAAATAAAAAATAAAANNAASQTSSRKGSGAAPASGSRHGSDGLGNLSKFLPPTTTPMVSGCDPTDASSVPAFLFPSMRPIPRHSGHRPQPSQSYDGDDDETDMELIRGRSDASDTAAAVAALGAAPQETPSLSATMTDAANGSITTVTPAASDLEGSSTARGAVSAPSTSTAAAACRASTAAPVSHSHTHTRLQPLSSDDSTDADTTDNNSPINDDAARAAFLLQAAGNVRGGGGGGGGSRFVSPRLNPLWIGLGEPVPPGFVANSGLELRADESSSETEDEEMAEHARHGHHHGGSRRHSVTARKLSLSSVASTRNTPASLRHDHPHSQSQGHITGLQTQASLRPSTLVHAASMSDTRLQQPSASPVHAHAMPSLPLPAVPAAGDAITCASTSASASAPSSRPLVPVLYSFPDAEELTSFDLDDLLPQGIFVLQWLDEDQLPANRRRRTMLESDSDSSDGEECEVAEVRNLRLRAQATPKHAQQAQTMSLPSNPSTSPLASGSHSALPQPFGQLSVQVSSSASPPAVSASTPADSTSASQLLEPARRPIHVWIGSQSGVELQGGDGDDGDAESVGAAIVSRFLQERARQMRAEAAVVHGADADAAMEDACATPTEPVDLSRYRICVEREGRESDEFIQGFQDG